MFNRVAFRLLSLFQTKTMQQLTDDRYGHKAIFTVQDMELVAAWRRIQKFRIKKLKDLKAGWFVSVRPTPALNNCAAEKLLVVGTPYKKSQGFVVDTRSFYTYWKATRVYESYHYFSDLSRSGGLYHLNSKVEAFTKMLQSADRFQQHCVMLDIPYTKENFDKWKSDMDSMEYMDRSLDDMLRDASRY